MSNHTSERKYATMMETSGEESESWYYFLRFDGNEEAIENLREQLESVEWIIQDDLSTFDIETKFLVSETTAKEMTKIDMNSVSHHRKFDGKMKMVNLKFKPKDSNTKKMRRAFDILGYGQIEDYITDEDIDPEDLVSGSESDNSEAKSASESVSSSEEEKNDKTGTEEKKPTPMGVPPAVLNSNLPRFAKAKQHRRKKHGPK